MEKEGFIKKVIRINEDIHIYRAFRKHRKPYFLKVLNISKQQNYK